MKSTAHTFTMEFNQITPQIYLGTNMCCSVHFSDLRDAGVNADLSMQKEPHTNAPGLEYYLQLPVTDTFAPTHEQILVGNQFISSVLRSGGKVYVHCKLGHGRSPTMVAAFFIAEHGMSVDEAITLITESRPEVHINKRQYKTLENFTLSLLR